MNYRGPQQHYIPTTAHSTASTPPATAATTSSTSTTNTSAPNNTSSSTHDNAATSNTSTHPSSGRGGRGRGGRGPQRGGHQHQQSHHPHQQPVPFYTQPNVAAVYPPAGSYPDFNNFVAAYTANSQPYSPVADSNSNAGSNTAVPSTSAPNTTAGTQSGSHSRSKAAENNRNPRQPRNKPRRNTEQVAPQEGSTEGAGEARQGGQQSRQPNIKQNRGPHQYVRTQRGRSEQQPPLTTTTTTTTTTAVGEALDPSSQSAADTKFVPKSTNYYRNQSRHTADADDLPSSIGDHTLLASKIIVKLNQNTYECMVCYDTIPRKAAVWWCDSCYALFHLSCVDKWSSKSFTEGIVCFKVDRLTLANNPTVTPMLYITRGRKTMQEFHQP